MEANCVFENIISFIKASNLNYHLEQTHFSAQISLKNSVVKDRSGSPLKLLPCPDSDKLNSLENENDMLLRKIRKYETEIDDIKVDLNQMKAHREASDVKIKNLEADLKSSSEDVHGHRDENTSLKKSLKSKNEEMKNLKNELKISNKTLTKKEGAILELEAKLEHVEGDNKTFRKKFYILKKENNKLEEEIKSSTATSFLTSISKTSPNSELFKNQLLISPANCTASPSISTSRLDKITSDSSSSSEVITAVKDEHALEKALQYTIETNNNFEFLDDSKNKESRASDRKGETNSEKIPKTNFANYEPAFKEFLQNFKEILSDSPKYPDVAKQMMERHITCSTSVSKMSEAPTLT